MLSRHPTIQKGNKLLKEKVDFYPKSTKQRLTGYGGTHLQPHRSRGGDKPGLHSETLSQKKTQNKTKLLLPHIHTHACINVHTHTPHVSIHTHLGSLEMMF